MTYKKILSLLTSLLLILLFIPNINAYDNNYYIKHYDVDIEVRENNSYYIIETLDVYFDVGANKHGIIRNIPRTNSIYRADGSTGRTKAKISDVTVDGGAAKISSDGDYLSIRIGSADEVVEGDVTYKISYIYDIGRDILKDKDEFYFNIIGDTWDTEINSVDFKVKFPKEFDYSKLGFVTGLTGNEADKDVYWRVEKDVVYGYYHKVLPAYNPITMRLELPEGYYTFVPSILERIGTFLMGLPILMLGFIYHLYKTYAKNEEPPEPIEFYPPDELNPLDIGYYYDTVLDDKDITSLLIYLANQGYLTINEADSKSDYTITLLKDSYEGTNEQERQFYNGLLKRANKSDGLVTKKRLKNSFYVVVDSIKRHYDTKKRKASIVVPTGKYQFLAIITGIAMMVLSLFFLVYYNTYDVMMATYTSIGITLLTAFYMPFVFASLKMKWFGKLIIWSILAIHMLVLFGMLFVFAIEHLIIHDKLHAILGIIGFIAGLVTLFISFKMFKRTDYGNQIYGRIKGFRNFLEEAEKERLEMLVDENPSYFYDILPYAHVLGVSSKWIKKFDNIAIPPPQWYTGYNNYSHHNFNNHINNTMNSFTNTMTSHPAPSGGSYSSSGSSGGFSSSSSSGGGSSGGGSGGGGGSSW